MGKITLSLSDEAEEELRELAEKEKRSITKEVEYLIEAYKKRNKKGVTKNLDEFK